MNSNTQQISLIFIQNNNINYIPATQQTKRNRNCTNLKIRELGEKYYTVKRIFDRLNIRRDTLFFMGKYLEIEYKNQKTDLHLQSQKRRMKDAIICWYAEHFFAELIQPNSSILQKLIMYNLNKCDFNNMNDKNRKQKVRMKRIEPKMPNVNIAQDDTNIDRLNKPDLLQNIQIKDESISKEQNNAEQIINTIDNSDESEHSENELCDEYQNDNLINCNVEIDDSADKTQNSIDCFPVQNAQNINTSDLKTIENSKLFTDMKVNQEIDSFENGDTVNYYSERSNLFI